MTGPVPFGPIPAGQHVTSCSRCGARIEQARATWIELAPYCGWRCARAAQMKIKSEREAAERAKALAGRACKRCGEPIPASRIPRAIYCSVACNNAAPGRDLQLITSDPAPQLTAVYLSNATRTSGGNGPGVVRVPPDEAGRLVRDKLAIHGTEPPRGLHGLEPAEIGRSANRTPGFGAGTSN